MNSADKLREKAKRYRNGEMRPTAENRVQTPADALDLLADTLEALLAAPHEPGCSGEFGYRCKCGREQIIQRIESYTDVEADGLTPSRRRLLT